METPVRLAPENSSQLFYQKLEGIMGISRDSSQGDYYVHKLAVFQAVSKAGTSERRSTRRLQRFPAAGVAAARDLLVLQSDEKAEGSSDERITRVELDLSTGKGSFSLSLWKGARTAGPPYFVQTYSFVFQAVAP